MKFPPLEAAGRHSLRHQSGFTLVEVTLAIGIMAFAFVSIFSLLPISMTMARDSMSKTFCAQITQSLIANVQQTPFAESNTFLNRISYYDGDAQLISSLSGADTAPSGYVYSAAVVDPSTHTSYNNPDRGVSLTRSKTLTVRIAINHKVSLGNNPQSGEKQVAFVISDVKI